MRYRLLSTVVLALVVGSLACGDEEQPTRPSILLLTVDTLRADRVSPDPRGAQIAPFLTSLAAGSTVFSSAHSTSSWTVPAAATLATGLYPHSHGITVGISRNGGVIAQPAIPPRIPRLAEELGRIGYRTYAVVSNAHLSGELGFAQGFDRFECVGFSPAEMVLAALAPWHDEITTGEAPVFLWLHFFDPHLPYNPREPWFTNFAPDVTDEERAVLERARETWPRYPAEVLAQPDRYFDIARKLYDSEVAYLDHHIAHLFETLPVLDDFLTVFTADHGEEFHEHGLLGHGNNLFTPSLQVPLWVRPPGGDRAAANSGVVSLVDVGPTILDAAGAVAPDAWPGQSLLGPVPEDRAVVAQLAKVRTRRLEGLISGRWKLVRHLPSEKVQLFDLSADRGEHHDLAADQPEELARQLARQESLLKTLPAPSAVPPSVPVSPEDLEMLEKLGYGG